jgi:maltose alpha-D-glucosyltransferase/alpha-amylase
MVLHDATADESFRQSLLNLVANGESLPFSEQSKDSATSTNQLRAHCSGTFAKVRGTVPMPAKVGSAEQSNTSILFDHKMIMKLFRKLQVGDNPDIEIGRFLTDIAHFPHIAPLLGEISITSTDGEVTALAMLQELIANEGDGWQWTLDELTRFYESVATCPIPADSGEPATFAAAGRVAEEVRQHAGLYLEAAGLLGKRTADLHLALATETQDEAFYAELLRTDDLQRDALRITRQLSATLEALRSRLTKLPDEIADEAAALLSRRVDLLARAGAISSLSPSGKRIRIHGDYHLGQVLRSRNDFVLLDFEGEPARTLEERRRKQCPLKDVAGMLRSFSYASWSALDQYTQRHPDRRNELIEWARLWEGAVSTEFLNAYRATVKVRADLLPKPVEADLLLQAYVLEKALYELLYELNNRPTWVHVPLFALLEMSERPTNT